MKCRGRGEDEGEEGQRLPSVTDLKLRLKRSQMAPFRFGRAALKTSSMPEPYDREGPIVCSTPTASSPTQCLLNLSGSR